MTYELRINGHTRTATKAGTHATILTRANSILDDIAAGGTGLGTFLLESSRVEIKLDENMRFEAEAVFTTYTHAAMQTWLRSVFGGVPVDLSAEVFEDSPQVQLMHATRVGTDVTWHLGELPQESSEQLP